MSDKLRRYVGERIDVTYDARRCIHAAECIRGLPAVFDTARRPWIRPDAATADAVAAVVARCPSGALHAIRNDGEPVETPPLPTVVRAIANGPLYIHGRVRLLHADGSVISEETRLALCRCGQSHNKPFCDNSHRAADFTTDDTAPSGGEGTGDGALLTLATLSD